MSSVPCFVLSDLEKMAFVNTEPPKLSKRRKLGKNKKKSWRAANVKDIEDFLTDERRQKESGGLVSDKADESLFVVDTGKAGETVLGAAPKGKRSRNRLLKCHALLLPDPHSRPVRKEEGSHFKQGERAKRILDRLRAKTETKKGLTAKLQRQQSIVDREKKREEKRKLPQMTSDIWAASDDVKSKVKPPKKYRKKPTALPATAVAHPGASVNPSYEDHQHLLQEALTVEKKKLKEEKKIHNALQKMFPTRENAPNEKTYIAEMSAGLVDDSDDDGDDENQVGDENMSLSVNPPVRRESKKTRRQRRIENKLTTEVKEKEKKTDVRRRENMVLRIRSLKSEIHKEETKQKEKAALKRKLKEEEPYKTKRLGSVKYQEPDLELKLSTELVGSFREVKPEGHLLNDMYSSLCKRNIVEPRIKQKRKRTYKKKVFDRK